MNYFETNLEEISRSIQLLVQIFEYQVFELQVEEKDGNQTGYVPYMMNDAIECYLSFHGLRIFGKNSTKTMRRRDVGTTGRTGRIELWVDCSSGRRKCFYNVV